RNSFVTLICVWKHFTDIAEPACTQQGVGNGMAQNVAIGVADQAFFMRNLNTTKRQGQRWPKAMQVITDPDPEFQCAALSLPSSSARKARASVRSLGRVILMFRSEPRTIATGSPSRSTRLDSSVP